MRFLISLAFVALVGCSASSTQTNDVAAAEVALTGAERLALVYTSLPRCPGATPCSDAATVATIKSLDNQAYAAVTAAKGNPSLVAAATAAVAALTNAIPASK